MVPAAPTITGTWFAQAVAQPGLVPEVMMSPSVKASVPLISGDGVPQAIVTSFDALLIVRLLNVVALVPPMFCVALEPVNVTLPVVAVKVPLLVQLPDVLPPPMVMAKAVPAELSLSVVPVWIVRSLRMLSGAPMEADGLPVVKTTRFQTLRVPAVVLVIRNGVMPVRAALPSWMVPPVTFCVPRRLRSSDPAAVAVAFWNTIAPPDIVNVVALPSINDSFVPAATVRSVMVPPAIVNCPLAPAVELTMPPVELNAPPFMMKRVVALVVRMSWLVFTVPIFQVPASIWNRPLVTVMLKLPLVTVAAALFSQKPSLTPMITAAMNGVMLLGLECL